MRTPLLPNPPMPSSPHFLGRLTRGIILPAAIPSRTPASAVLPPYDNVKFKTIKTIKTALSKFALNIGLLLNPPPLAIKNNQNKQKRAGSLLTSTAAVSANQAGALQSLPRAKPKGVRPLAAVGIIANPQSGKDIRRLVAHASVFDNQEKVNIVRRVLIGLDAVGVRQAFIMPDYFGIGERALHGLHLDLHTELLDFPLTNTDADSTLAAAELHKQGVHVIITLGGDGTNRAVAKASGVIPLMPISTGTNNVFPQFIEGTLAGMAAGLVATGVVTSDVIEPTLRLDILRQDELLDIALVDAVVYDAPAIATRAIWDAEGIRQIILTRTEPDRIGLSAIGSALGITLAPNEGLYLETGAGSSTVLAPIAPGLLQPVNIRTARKLQLNESITITHTPAALALDGERTLMLNPRDHYAVRLNPNGPRVINVRAALAQAAASGFFLQQGENNA